MPATTAHPACAAAARSGGAPSSSGSSVFSGKPAASRAPPLRRSADNRSHAPPPRLRGRACAATDGSSSGNGPTEARPTPSPADQVRLLQAARAYAALADEEEDEEDVVARAALNLGGKDDMSDLQRRYAAKIAEALAEKAAELAAKKRQGSEAFTIGQFLYERGRYPEAVESLEEAVKETGQQTGLGGEVRAPRCAAPALRCAACLCASQTTLTRSRVSTQTHEHTRHAARRLRSGLRSRTTPTGSASSASTCTKSSRTDTPRGYACAACGMRCACTTTDAALTRVPRCVRALHRTSGSRLLTCATFWRRRSWRLGRTSASPFRPLTTRQPSSARARSTTR
jgi:hypothetical protein